MANPSFDTAVAGQGNGTNAILLTITTTQPNEGIIVYSHVSNSSAITSVTCVGVTFVKDGPTLLLVSGQMERWRALAASPLTGAIIQVNTTGFPQQSAVAIAIKDVDTTGTNGSGFMGATLDSVGSGTSSLASAVTTTRANSLVIGGAGQTFDGTYTAGASQTQQATSSIVGGFSHIGGFTQNANTASSGTAVTMSASSTVANAWGMMANEIKGAAATSIAPPNRPLRQAVNRASTY